MSPTVIGDDELAALVRAPDRLEMWVRFVSAKRLETVAEVGVYRGEFAEGLLRSCPSVAAYYLIDPWKHLEDWNKPANRSDGTFESIYREAMRRTQPWESKRIVLRGRTVEMSHSIPDGSLDLAYVDADHTLRGISIDLIRMWPKVKEGGYLGGDDFCPSAWQHHRSFEPTLVYPFAVYFAEAMNAPIVALPHNQFLIRKVENGSFLDTTGMYREPTLRRALSTGAGPLVARIRRSLRRPVRRADH